MDRINQVDVSTLYYCIGTLCFGCRNGIDVHPNGSGGLVHDNGYGMCSLALLRESQPQAFADHQKIARYNAKAIVPSVLQQPTPEYQEDQRAIWACVIEDMRHRDAFGARKYGTRLQAFNGRDPIIDAYQEALDLVVYLKQLFIERARAIRLLEGLTIAEPDSRSRAIDLVLNILKGTQ